MSITDELRKSFDQCTYKAGVAPNEFDTVWIVKSFALSMLDDIDAAFEAGHSRAVKYGKEMGRGTCHLEEVTSCGYPFECSECRAWYGVDILRGELLFCPNCGRKVVNE